MKAALERPVFGQSGHVTKASGTVSTCSFFDEICDGHWRVSEAGDQDAVVFFGPFRLFPKLRRLERDGVPISIGGRALDLLICLVEHAGDIVDKRELVRRVWADVHVDDGSLRFHITTLRKTLGETDGSARYIVNVAGRGYCFAAPLLRTSPVDQAPIELPPRHLPAPLSNMIGRDEAVEAISAEIARHRFVAIVGPGGIGKTAVALAVAHRAQPALDGEVSFVDFGARTDATPIDGTIAEALGLTVDSDDPIAGLTAWLHDRRMLLVFDSCEHIIDALAPLAERLVRESSALHVLATSRESFRIDGERIHRLFPLDCPLPGEPIGVADILAYPACRLFLERVAESQRDFELGEEEAPVVADICRRLDGIALAIELAAGRVSTYGIAGTAALLDSRFALLWRGRRTAIPRHQTLSAALGWSYDLLPAAESAALRVLSVFDGPFTLEAAVAMVSSQGIAEPVAIEAISNLLAKSLIATTPRERGLRYRLLDTTRAFAADKLAESGHAAEVARVYAEYQRCLLQSQPDPAAGDVLATPNKS